MPFDRGPLRVEYETEWSQWILPAQVKRFIATTDSRGGDTGTFQEVKAVEDVWIQPISRGNETVDMAGGVAEITHNLYQKHDGFPLIPKDKVFWTDLDGQAHEFDVIRVHYKEVFRIAELKEVLRDPT